MSRVQRLVRFVDTLNDRIGAIFSWLIIPLMLVLTLEVILRYVFNRPTIWAHETTQMIFGASILIGGAYALRWDTHVNMDFIYNRFSQRGKAVADLLTYTLFFLFCSVLVWKTAGAAWISLQQMEYSPSVWGPPVWPIKLLMPVAAVLMFMQGVAKYIRVAYMAIVGRELSTPDIGRGGE